MKKNAKIYLYCLHISIFIINLATLINGIRQHETWMIVLGSIALALMLAAVTLTAMGYKRNKEEQVS
jgi:dolichol kinase